MLLCKTLRQAQMGYVQFDPTDRNHLVAFQTLCLGIDEGNGVTNRQHSTLRFELEEGFADIRTMMFHKVGQQYLNLVEPRLEPMPIEALLNS